MVSKNEKKVILYTGFFSLPDSDAAANRVMNNARALAECGHTVVFIDEQQNCVYDNLAKSKHRIECFDVWSLSRPCGIKAYLKKMTNIDYIKYVIDQYPCVDLVIAYNFPSVALHKLKKYCNQRGIKIAADCTEWYSGQEYSFPMNVLCAGDSWLRMRVEQKKLDGVICISSFLHNYYKPFVKTVFIPPLVDAQNEKWHQEKSEYDSEKINLVYAGNPGKSKELMLPVIEGIQRSVNKHRIHFRVVGITKQQFLDLYHDSIDMIRELENNVEFLGRMSHKDTVRVVSSSDFMIFLRPQNRVSAAGFSTKFVESITGGTAIISNNTGDIRPFVEKIGQGYVIDRIDQLQDILNENFCILKYNGGQLNNAASRLFDYREYKGKMNVWIQEILDER